MRYWIIVASRNHVQIGVQGGFAQANHGKSSPLKRMRPGDWVIYYSSKEEFGEEAKCQKFTAIGTVRDDRVYEGDMGSFKPSRRDVDYRPCIEVSILPLIPELSFIQDKKRWGAPFRFGMLEIPQTDFDRIAQCMLQA
jgi:predicted RNA-binding protein